MGCVPVDSECDEGEEPRHQVAIGRGFWLGRSEVTVGAYGRFVEEMRLWMPEAPDFDATWSRKDRPIVQATWHEANAYCKWAGGRLPTEAEWEYAARGGRQGQVYPWGNTIGRERANYGRGEDEAAEDSDVPAASSPTCSFAVTGHGLCDMSGNASEWVADWYDAAYYQRSPSEDPQGPATGEEGVVRGGSWSHGPRLLRSSARFSVARGLRRSSFGFRCALEAIP